MSFVEMLDAFGADFVLPMLELDFVDAVLLLLGVVGGFRLGVDEVFEVTVLTMASRSFVFLTLNVACGNRPMTGQFRQNP